MHTGIDADDDACRKIMTFPSLSFCVNYINTGLRVHIWLIFFQLDNKHNICYDICVDELFCFSWKYKFKYTVEKYPFRVVKRK